MTSTGGGLEPIEPTTRGGRARPSRDGIPRTGYLRRVLNANSIIGPDRLLAGLLILSGATFVALQMGSSLLGLRVFVGSGLLNLFAPYSAMSGGAGVHTSFYVSDQLDGILPAAHEIAMRLWHGEIAGWSSLATGGQPLLATPSLGLISPGRWTYLVLPTWLAPAWSHLLEMAFAALFAYLFVRRLRGSKLAAGVAGLVYPLTGFMIAWTGWPQTAVACAIPMMFWAVERYVQQPRLRNAAPASVAAALLLFGGFPAVAGQAFMFATAYALMRLIQTSAGSVRHLAERAATLAVAAAVGAGITAIQLLPFIHSTLDGSNLSYRTDDFFSQAPVKFMLTSIFPASFAGNQLWVGASPMDLDSYIGAVVLLLVVIGALRSLCATRMRAIGVYMLASLALIIGLIWFQGGWSSWLDHVPVLHGNPIGRIRSQAAIPVAVLAAFGFDGIRHNQIFVGHSSESRSRARWLVPSTAAAVSLALAAIGIRFAAGDRTGLSNHVTLDVAIAVIPVLVIAGLLVVSLKWRYARVLALAAVIGSVALQAVPASHFYWPTTTRSAFYPPSPAIDYLRSHQGHDSIASAGYALRPNVTQYYGIRAIDGHGFVPKQMQQLITAIAPNGYDGPTYSRFIPGDLQTATSPGLDRLGVRYYAAPVPEVLPGQPTPPVFGRADPPAPAGGSSVDLMPGTAQVVSVQAGSIRGVIVPVISHQATTLTVSLATPAGKLLARNSRQMAAGTAPVPVPLAYDAPNRPARDSGRLVVSIAASTPGVSVEADTEGRMRIQAIRADTASAGLRLAYAGDGMVIWERLDAQPRIRWATHAEVIADSQARLDAVAHAAVDPEWVILAQAPHSPGATSGTSGGAEVRVDEDGGDSIKVAVRAKAAGYLVVAESIQDDFAAYVDGHRTPILDADYAVGAVQVPAGEHLVQLRYEPRGQRTGELVSVVCLITVLSAFGADRIRARRRHRRRTLESDDHDVLAPEQSS